MAGLSAAFELTRTQTLRERHNVTLYQMGWRLGGKCASGRDDQGRNIEHGLHIWFGYYANAFRLLRDVYDEWKAPTGQRIRNPAGAFKPQQWTAIGDGAGNRPEFYPLPWPDSTGTPGKEAPEMDELRLSVWASAVQVLDLAVTLYEKAVPPSKDHELKRREPRVSVDRPLLDLCSNAIALSAVRSPDPNGLADARQNQAEPLSVGDNLRRAKQWAEAIDGHRANLIPEHATGIVKMLKTTSGALLQKKEFVDIPKGKVVAQTIDVATAFFSGIVFDVLLYGTEISRLDDLDFRQWLVRHGAKRSSADESPAVRALYDTMFQYPEGDRTRASYGAGTAAQVVLRMLGTYQKAFAWQLQAGAGEVIVAPLYEVLRSNRNVKFCFFHKLVGIELTSDRAAVKCLHFTKQVELADRDRDYEPTLMCNGLLSWPSSPKWNCLEGGEKLRERSVNLESYWCEQTAGRVTLERGTDFDDVVLAIPLGAFKRNNAARGPCEQLIAASPRFRAMTDNLVLVPSISAQVWFSADFQAPDWAKTKPAVVSGPEPLAIWADMSEIIKSERRGPSVRTPKSVYYFCDVLSSPLYRQPPSKRDTLKKANANARELAIGWLKTQAPSVWPGLKKNGQFDWSALFASPTKSGVKRFDEQVVRANIDPAECCVASSAGTTAYRLKADDSGFDHLYLAGSWIDTGFNTECIEAAVMSGMQAARAICGQPTSVPGENFLHPSGEVDAIRALIFAGLRFLTGAWLVEPGQGP